MNIIKVKDYQEMSNRASMHVTDKIQKLDKPVIGLATGSTPEGMYQQLIEKYNKGEVSFKDVTTFNLDEYVGMKEENPNSYYFYMMDNFFNHVDVPTANIYLPKGAAEDVEKECRDYEKLIRNAGYVDVQVLGIGENGHIGFNEPGTSFSSRTHVVDLDESTRQANARFFDSIEEVPKQAITMGIETIMESKEILLLASGEKKANALARLLQSNEINEDFPASILRKHDNVTIIADEAALGNN